MRKECENMKKAYFICLLLLCCGIAFGWSFYQFSNNTKPEYQENRMEEETIAIERMTQAGLNDIRINNLTTVKLQTYDVGMELVQEEKINTPVEFLEMTRADLIAYLKDYMLNPSEEDRQKGLVSYELVEFSRSEVVLRKAYQLSPEKEQEGLRAINENGYIAIYYTGERMLYDYTNIEVHRLPKEVQNELENGIDFKDEGALYEFLEAYTS